MWHFGLLSIMTTISIRFHGSRSSLFLDKTKIFVLLSVDSLKLSSMGLKSFLTTVPSAFLATILTETLSVMQDLSAPFLLV